MVNIPRIPQEIIDEILNRLAADSDRWSLRECALVSKSWLPSCRRHLFRAIHFNRADVDRWLKTFPVPEESPAHHFRDLSVEVKLGELFLEEFSEHIPWFTSVESFNLMWRGGAPRSSLRLPRSVTSLTLKLGAVALLRIRDVMVQLPDLDSLSLSGSLGPMDRRLLPGIGTVLRGRFGGKLQLLKGLAHEDVMNMLLEVPTGLHFTEIRIRDARECPLSVVRLVEACGKPLVRLSYMTSCGEFRLLSRSG